MSKFQVLQIAFIVAVIIVCLQNWQMLVEWFGLSAFALQSFQWALSQATAQSSTDEQFVGEEPEPSCESAEPVEDVKHAVAVEMAAGTDDLSEAGALTMAKTQKTPFTTTDVLVLLQRQLESLPQTHQRRKVWSALCSELSVKGGGKVRDAKILQKAKFLADAGVSPTQLVKAKVRVLTMSAA